MSRTPWQFERTTHLLLSRVLVRIARSARKDDLSLLELAALHMIDEDGKTNVGSFAGGLGLTMPAASRLVEGLIQRGLLMRVEWEDDRRLKLVRLSTRGAELVGRTVKEHAADLYETVEEKLPASLREQVFARLAKLF